MTDVRWRDSGVTIVGPPFDPVDYVISANIRRRHLSADQKRDLIAKLIKATPEKSDRQIAETVKASPTTVGTVRAEMEAKGDVSKLDTRTDSKGRQQPARKGWSDERFRRHRHARTEGLAVPLAGARKTVEILTELRSLRSDRRVPARSAPACRIRSRPCSKVCSRTPSRPTPKVVISPIVSANLPGCRQGYELENALRQRDIKIAGLESEVVELEAARASECPDVKAAAEIIEANFDQFIAAMSPTLRAKLERKVRAEKNGGDGDIDPDRTITRMLQDAIACAVAAEDPNTEPGGAVAESNRAKAQKLLRDTDRKVRSRGFVRSNLITGIDPGAKPRRAAAVADETTVVAAADTPKVTTVQ